MSRRLVITRVVLKEEGLTHVMLEDGSRIKLSDAELAEAQTSGGVPVLSSEPVASLEAEQNADAPPRRRGRKRR